MNENLPQVSEMTEDQRRIYIDTCQVYEGYTSAYGRAQDFKGSMCWKRSKGKEYLFRLLDRKGYGKSLGPRSVETERILTDFKSGKEKAREVLKSLKKRLSEQARFAKAASIQRVPTIATRILSLLNERGLLGSGLIVIGTNALFAYEAAAGVFFDASIMATKDIDVLMDVRGHLSLAGEDDAGLIDTLKKADSSFDIIQAGAFRAVNKDGYMVDLIRPMPSPPWKDARRSVGGAEDLQAVDGEKLDWLLNAPKLSQIVIGQDGFPMRIVSPDPRVFSAHKLWLSRQESREPVKKPRDRLQALAVADITGRYLPQYKFDSSELQMLPRDLAEEVCRAAQEIG